MTDAKLKYVMEKLHLQGKRAEVESRMSSKRGPQIGLVVEEFFYPMWELADEENDRLAGMLDFEAIRRKRPSDWTFEHKI